MLPESLQNITIESLQALIDQRVHEGKLIEFKQALWRLDTKTNTNPVDISKQRIEFLKDLSSFANTEGGHLIVGIEEDDGIAQTLLGITITEQEACRSRLDQLLQSWIEPRISASMRFVTLDSGKHALVFYVAPSRIGPHRVTYDNCGQFFARNSTGAYAMSTDELRSAFTRSLSLADRLQEFRANRIQLIEGQHLPVPLEELPRVVMHIIPQESFTSVREFTIDQLKQNEQLLKPPGSRHPPFCRPNLDGYLAHVGTMERGGPTSGYVQLFRNGVVEAGFTGISFQRANGTPRFWSPPTEASLITALADYLKYISKLGLLPPAWLFVSLSRMREVHFPSEGGEARQFDRNLILLPEYLISDFDDSAHSILLPVFDQIWNAVGFDKCYRLNEKGETLRLYMDRFI
jgi:hypothetical protein